jgi:hypothetical protein
LEAESPFCLLQSQPDRQDCMDKLTAVEWDIVSARVKAAVTTHRLPTSSLGFLHVVLEQFFPGRSGGFSEIITDGGNDLGIDAIEILEREDRAEIFVFQAKYRDALKSADKTINDSDVLKILNFLHALFEKASFLRTTGNLQLTEAVTRIWELHERGAICRYRIVFCSNDRGLSSSAKTLFENGLNGLPGVGYEEYGARDLIRDVGVAGRQRESGQLCVVGREIFERSDGDIRGVVASVDAASFVKLIQTEDGRSVRRHLFDDNLRVFLGANGGFPARSSRRPRRMTAISSGISTTASPLPVAITRTTRATPTRRFESRTFRLSMERRPPIRCWKPHAARQKPCKTWC